VGTHQATIQLKKIQKEEIESKITIASMTQPHRMTEANRILKKKLKPLADALEDWIKKHP